MKQISKIAGAVAILFLISIAPYCQRTWCPKRRHCAAVGQPSRSGSRPAQHLARPRSDHSRCHPGSGPAPARPRPAVGATTQQ